METKDIKQWSRMVLSSQKNLLLYVFFFSSLERSSHFSSSFNVLHRICKSTELTIVIHFGELVCRLCSTYILPLDKTPLIWIYIWYNTFTIIVSWVFCFSFIPINLLLFSSNFCSLLPFPVAGCAHNRICLMSCLWLDQIILMPEHSEWRETCTWIVFEKRLQTHWLITTKANFSYSLVWVFFGVLLLFHHYFL